MPGRWAAPPAPAISTPRGRARRRWRRTGARECGARTPRALHARRRWRAYPRRAAASPSPTPIPMMMPTRGFIEAFSTRRARPGACRQRTLQRFRIHGAHQPADVLALARQRRARLVRRRASVSAARGRSSASSSTCRSSGGVTPSRCAARAARLRASDLGAPSPASVGGGQTVSHPALSIRRPLRPKGCYNCASCHSKSTLRGSQSSRLSSAASSRPRGRPAPARPRPTPACNAVLRPRCAWACDTIEYHRDRGLAVTVYFGQRKGSASTADIAPAAVRETVAKAAAIARHTASDNCAGPTPPCSRATFPTSISTTLADRARGGGRARLRGRGLRRRQAAQQFRRCDAHQRPPWRARLRQYAWVPCRIHQFAIRSVVRCWRKALARCSVITGTPWRATRRRSRTSRPWVVVRPNAHSRVSAAGASIPARRRCCSPRDRSRPARLLRRRSVASASIAGLHSCWAPPASGYFPRSCSSRSARVARSRVRPSIPRAWPRATANWSSTVCCRAMCSAAPRHANSGSRRPAMPAASTTCSSMPVQPRELSRSAAPHGPRTVRHRAHGHMNGVTGDYSRGATMGRGRRHCLPSPRSSRDSRGT